MEPTDTLRTSVWLPAPTPSSRPPTCPACGVRVTRSRLFCTPPCRRRLARVFDYVDRLLAHLGTRYAVLAWTDDAVCLDCLGAGSVQISRLTTARQGQERPAEGLWRLYNHYGDWWHAARRRLGSQGRASRALLAHTVTPALDPAALVRLAQAPPRLSLREHAACHVLGLEPDALQHIPTPERRQHIQRAYRQMARRVHPDYHGGTPQAHRAMRDVIEAYTVMQQWRPGPLVTDRWRSLRSPACWVNHYTASPYP
jgi:hypothetical protein